MSDREGKYLNWKGTLAGITLSTAIMVMLSGCCHLVKIDREVYWLCVGMLKDDVVKQLGEPEEWLIDPYSGDTVFYYYDYIPHTADLYLYKIAFSDDKLKSVKKVFKKGNPG